MVSHKIKTRAAARAPAVSPAGPARAPAAQVAQVRPVAPALAPPPQVVRHHLAVLQAPALGPMARPQVLAVAPCRHDALQLLLRRLNALLAVIAPASQASKTTAA